MTRLHPPHPSPRRPARGRVVSLQRVDPHQHSTRTCADQARNDWDGCDTATPTPTGPQQEGAQYPATHGPGGASCRIRRSYGPSYALAPAQEGVGSPAGPRARAHEDQSDSRHQGAPVARGEAEDRAPREQPSPSQPAFPDRKPPPATDPARGPRLVGGRGGRGAGHNADRGQQRFTAGPSTAGRSRTERGRDRRTHRPRPPRTFVADPLTGLRPGGVGEEPLSF